MEKCKECRQYDWNWCCGFATYFHVNPEDDACTLFDARGRCGNCKYYQDNYTCTGFEYEKVTYPNCAGCSIYMQKETTPPNFNNIRFCAFCAHMDRKNSICTKYAGFKVNAYSVCDSHKYEGEK